MASTHCSARSRCRRISSLPEAWLLRYSVRSRKNCARCTSWNSRPSAGQSRENRHRVRSGRPPSLRLPTTPADSSGCQSVTARPFMRSDSPQHRLQLIGRHHFKIIGEIESRRAIQDAAVRLHQLMNSILPRFCEPWNIMCSNKCAKAGAVPRLNPEADAVVHTNANGWRRMVWRQNHAQAIGSL